MSRLIVTMCLPHRSMHHLGYNAALHSQKIKNWIFATGKVVVNVTPGIRYTIRPLKKPMRLWFLELSRRISTTQKDGTLTGMKSASDPSVVPLGVDTETIWYIKPSETKLMGNWSFMHQKTALIPDNIE
ncbi:hypothetical protein MG293_011243 [Ovis ammon polii]|uniref:Uncharacterized protein n=1 Tax=Ovis ammon polii TaxID=230172 RepID=A0AAD4YA54_OVIAM|nr:hypothetical protein MG293_011243 [Ovis ammon polii]